MPRLLYYCAALLLGAFWHVALEISFLPRFAHARLRFPEPQDLLEPRFLLMCAVSLTLAVAFRRFIIRADTLPRALATAIGLPLVGAILYAVAFVTPKAFLEADSVSALLSSIPVVMLMGIIYELMIAAAALWIVLPMGLVSQLVMGAIGRGKLSSADGRLFLLTATSIAAAVAYAAALVPFR